MSTKFYTARRATVVFAALGLLSLAGNPASAGLVTKSYQLDQSNEFSDGPIYGTVKIDIDPDDDGTSTLARFTVTANTSPYTSILSNFGIQNFGFNSSDSALVVVAASLPSGWSVSFNQTRDGFGRFDFALDTVGSTRENPLVFEVSSTSALTHSVFEVLQVDQNPPSQYYFAAHVTDVTMAGSTKTSHWIAGSDELTPGPPAVPEPSTLAMALISVGTLGFVQLRRRRQSRDSA